MENYRDAYLQSKLKSESLNIHRRSFEYDLAVTDTSTKGKAVALSPRSSLNSIRTNLQNHALIDDRNSIDSQILNRAKALQNRKYDFGPQVEVEPNSARNSTELNTKRAIHGNE
jgi:hypothetical protein